MKWGPLLLVEQEECRVCHRLIMVQLSLTHHETLDKSSHFHGDRLTPL